MPRFWRQVHITLFLFWPSPLTILSNIHISWTSSALGQSGIINWYLFHLCIEPNCIRNNLLIIKVKFSSNHLEIFHSLQPYALNLVIFPCVKNWRIRIMLPSALLLDIMIFYCGIFDVAKPITGSTPLPSPMYSHSSFAMCWELERGITLPSALLLVIMIFDYVIFDVARPITGSPPLMKGKSNDCASTSSRFASTNCNSSIINLIFSQHHWQVLEFQTQDSLSFPMIKSFV